jgi:uncharacterized protein YbjT (DUF2867 family)
MSQPILITGAAGGSQGSTGRLVTALLLKQGIPVRAFVHKLDTRSDELSQQGAEIVEGDLLNPASVQAELVVNNSQFHGTPDDPAFRDLQCALSFRNLQHRLHLTHLWQLPAGMHKRCRSSSEPMPDLSAPRVNEVTLRHSSK